MSDAQNSRLLSSHLSRVVTIVGAALVLTGYAAVWHAVLFGSATAEPLWIRAGAVVLGAAGALIVYRFWEYHEVELADREVVVRGLWREWRIPAACIVEAEEHPVGQYYTVVRVAFDRRVPGLGQRVSFLTPFLGHGTWSAADLLESARDLPPPRSGA